MGELLGGGVSLGTWTNLVPPTIPNWDFEPGKVKEVSRSSESGLSSPKREACDPHAVQCSHEL